MEIDKANVALKTNSCTQIKKRSSLKMNDSISKGELEQLQQRCKRLSVNWDKSINFKSLNMKNIKTSFDDNIAKGNDDIMKLKLFNEKRKNSIKNEFGLVREFLKSANIDEVDEEDENAITIKENTKKNIEFGKQREEFSDSDSDSDSHSEQNIVNSSDENLD